MKIRRDMPNSHAIILTRHTTNFKVLQVLCSRSCGETFLWPQREPPAASCNLPSCSKLSEREVLKQLLRELKHSFPEHRSLLAPSASGLRQSAPARADGTATRSAGVRR